MKIEYNNLYTHFVLTTLDRKPIIPEEHRNRIEKYITGIVAHHGSKLYAIYANPEHVHLLISRGPSFSEEKLLSLIAKGSEEFINENHLVKGPFKWQQSASAFSISKSHIDRICHYILNQPKHHQKESCQEEYERYLKHYQQQTKKSL
ncbi:MAG: transposase [Verrucomicrobia bacterium]|nr:transposase [Prolixibacteraceae bacterium]